jgi:hypothetical protein
MLQSHEQPSFYEKLPVLDDFTAVTDPTHYHTIPDDWLLWWPMCAVRRRRLSKGCIKQSIFWGHRLLSGC